MRSTNAHSVRQGLLLALAVVAATPRCRAAEAPAASDVRSLIVAGDHARAEAEILGLLRSGAFAAAEPLLALLVERQPSVARYRYFHGFALLQLYQFDAAERELRMAVAASPREDAWLEALAKVLVDQGRPAQALVFLDKALAIRALPQYDAARASCLINLGRTAEAEAALRTCLEKEPGNAGASFRLGELLQNRGLDAESRALFEQSLRVDSGNVEARFRLGLALMKTGDTEPAAEAFNVVLAAVPSHVGALYNLARIRARQGQQEEAARHLRAFADASKLEDLIEFKKGNVKLAPGDVGRKLELVDLLLQAGRNDEALSELRPLVLTDGRDARTLSLLSIALRRLGHVGEAAAAEAAARSAERR